MLKITTTDWVATIEAPDFSPLGRSDAGFARALRNAVVDLSDDDFVKVIVLRATGPDFAPATSGLVPAADKVFTNWTQDIAGASALYQSLTFSKKIIITEVAGECSGAGSMLVLASDLTVASEDSTFASPFREHPEANFVLAALTIRLNRAKAWLLQGQAIDARDAHDFGLVNSIVSPELLTDRTANQARAAARMPLDGVVMSKMLQQAVLDSHGVGRDYDMASFYAAGMLAEQQMATIEETRTNA